MGYLRKERYDYFLIWGNGMPYKEEILDIIRSKGFLKILRIMNHRPKSIAKLVRTIYSYDYAPLQHLKSKTRYLLKTDPDVVFIFAHNQDAKEIHRGRGAFRHIECERIKSVKEEIRNKFNPRKEGKRTEEHVIHASDNESQVHHVLKYLGVKEGIHFLRNVPNPFLSLPYYLPKFDSFTIRQVGSTQLYCNILEKTANLFRKKVTPIEQTPHFRCLTGNVAAYKAYLAECRLDGRLKSDYSASRFFKLAQNLTYLQEPYTTSYILVREFQPDRYLILDGIHRASILKLRSIDSITVAVIR